VADVAVTTDPGDVDVDELWGAYSAVFDDQADLASWREGTWDRHSARPGFRLARAYDGGALVGFAYGYTGDAGQWWTDTVRTTLPPDVADAWLGGHFEVVTLGVVPSARRVGLGRALMRALTDGLPHDRLLLQTSDDPADPARQLYAAEGWAVLGPGTGPSTVVMGRR
jgi:ribosomal protein S18 acetylase RimI-like enzyme